MAHAGPKSLTVLSEQLDLDTQAGRETLRRAALKATAGLSSDQAADLVDALSVAIDALEPAGIIGAEADARRALLTAAGAVDAAFYRRYQADQQR